MPFSLKRRLLSLVYPLLNLFKIMPAPTLQGPEFTAYEVPVDLYLELLQGRYPTLADAQRLRVVTATLWKQHGIAQHEYIVFAVLSPADVTYHFLFERMPDALPTQSDASLATQSDTSLPTASTPSSTNPSSPLPRPSVGPRSITLRSPNPSLTSLDSSSKDRTAKDIVKWLPKCSKRTSDVCMASLDFPSEPLFIYHVAALAVTIHAKYGLYRLFSQNCYFMAGVMMAFLESAGGRRKDETQKKSSRFVEGSWNGYGTTFDPSHPEVVEIVKDLRSAYDEAVLAFENNLKEKAEQQKQRLESNQAQAEEMRKELDAQAQSAKAIEERALAKERESDAQVQSAKAREERALARERELDAQAQSAKAREERALAKEREWEERMLARERELDAQAQSAKAMEERALAKEREMEERALAKARVWEERMLAKERVWKEQARELAAVKAQLSAQPSSSS